MKKSTILFIFLSFLTTSILAQGYRTAAGLRLGTGQGSGIAVTVNQKLWNRTSFEGIVQPSFNNNESSVDLLIKQHQKVIFDRLNIFVGGGIHKNWRHQNHENAFKAHTGASGIIGAEVTFKKLNISWDYIPSLNVWGGDLFFQNQSAVSLRMVIIPKKKEEPKWKFWKKKKSRKEIRRDRRKKRKRKKNNSFSWKFWE